jgi:hypothetical protein
VPKRPSGREGWSDATTRLRRLESLGRAKDIDTKRYTAESLWRDTRVPVNRIQLAALVGVKRGTVVNWVKEWAEDDLSRCSSPTTSASEPSRVPDALGRMQKARGQQRPTTYRKRLAPDADGTTATGSRGGAGAGTSCHHGHRQGVGAPPIPEDQDAQGVHPTPELHRCVVHTHAISVSNVESDFLKSGGDFLSVGGNFSGGVFWIWGCRPRQSLDYRYGLLLAG